MNSSQNNIDIEKRFLEEIATKYQLFDEYKRIFLCRFDRKNAELQNTEIAGDKHLDIDEQELQKYLRKICDLFGHKVNKRGRPKSDESPWKNVFDDLWNNKFNEWLKLQQNPNVQIPILNDDDWLKICHTKLDNQQKQIRKNASEMRFELDFPPVPLGLVERKHQQRRDENVDRREVYQLEKEVIAKIYEHNDFLEQVINQNPAIKNKHIAIVGEPGAGKTTLLTAIASYIKNENKDLPIVISLGSLQGMTLEEYILKKWLPDITPTSKIEEQLKTRFYKGGVWLLLDGVDEMGESSPTAALNKISQALTDWLGKARVVLTCRLNVWDASLTNNELPGFDTYKTQEFKPEDIDKFIEEWFKCDDKIQRGEELKAKLREQGKERIRELVTNPLRLSLLCQIFYQNQHSDLPETTAELFGLYTQYFYDWKRELVSQNLNYTLKQELHQALGKLAREGIESYTRFRLNESFAVKEMGQDLFDLACNVGWLNLVDRDASSNEAVYAFFHPNFQEYFAALVIDDWRYFLNHNNESPNPFIKHNNQDCVYRIFEDKWQEVILLWIGRKNILPSLKNKFMLEISNFKDGCGFGNILKYWLSYIATQCLKEFPDCILNTISREYEDESFTQFDDMWEMHLIDPCYFCSPSSSREFLINNLGTWMHYHKFYDVSISDSELMFQFDDYEKKFQIDSYDNYQAMIRQLEFKNYENCKEIIKYLEIACNEDIKVINNSVQIIGMIDIIINDECHKFLKGAIINRLIQICSEDNTNIIHVIRKINCNLNDDSLASLIYIIHHSSYYDLDIIDICIQILYKSSQGTTLVAALDYLLSYLHNIRDHKISQFYFISLHSDKLELGFLVPKHNYWYLCEILWNCTQNMTYPEFYRAWHGEPSPIQNLENQFTDTHSLLSQLQPTEKTYPLTLNLKTLQNETDIIEISQEICNQIYFIACPKNPEIPQINNAPQLKSKIPQIKKYLPTENLVLIINNCEPNQEMIKFCNKLTDVLHIAFITEQPLDAPLKGFPNQPNLLNIIQNWINEIG